MHFIVVVFSRSPDNLGSMLEPFNYNVDPASSFSEFIEDVTCDIDEVAGRRGYWTNPEGKYDYYDPDGPIRRWFATKAGDRVNKGFARELHFNGMSNRRVSEALNRMPGHAMSDLHLINVLPHAFVTPDRDWVCLCDNDTQTFCRLYMNMVGSAKRHNYYVHAVDCHA